MSLAPRTGSTLLALALAGASVAAAAAGFSVRAPIEMPRLPAEIPRAPVETPRAVEPASPGATPVDRIQSTTLMPPRPSAIGPTGDHSLHMPVTVGFIVSTDGVVVASHMQLSRCSRVAALLPQGRADADTVGTEGDVVILRIAGGPYVPLPPGPPVARWTQPVTLLGSDPARWRVAAGDLLPAGSNPGDEGWPQVRTLPAVHIDAGPVWAEDGSVVGIGIAGAAALGGNGVLRLIPSGTLQTLLASHGIAWSRPLGAPRLDTDAAMRRALGATVRLACG